MDTECIQVRRELMTDPKNRAPEVLQHIASCSSCSDYVQNLGHFENKLDPALRLDVPEGLESRIILAQRMGKKATTPEKRFSDFRWMSMAAAIVLAVGLSIGIFKLGESHGVEQEVLAHIYYELDLLHTDNNLSLTSLNSILHQHGIQALETIGHIRHAANCPIDNKPVPHLILDDGGHAITVMYIPWEHTAKRTLFNDKRFNGVLVGAEKGSFVIVSEDEHSLNELEERVMSSFETRI